MSRPQTHRKSQSTSALSFLASNPQPYHHLQPRLPETPRHSRPSRPRASQLPAVDESSTSARVSAISGLSTPETGYSEGMRRTRSSQTQRQSHHAQKSGPSRDTVPTEGVEDWLNDVRSLRSSSRRRLAALKSLERTLVESCMNEQSSKSTSLQDLLKRHIHHPLLSLLVRHTSTLSQRSSSTSIPPNDELAGSLIPELSVIVGMLQGLCLLSRECKNAVGASWVLEIFIDLLLLLRAQSTTTNDEKPIAYGIMELLFCVLVDSPGNARTFEKLCGLEAVVRVLKGTGVTKDVRMKCIEFLYFYLLPEQTVPQRTVSSASSSSSSSSDSQLYPPSPLSTSRSSLGSSSSPYVSDGRLSHDSHGRKDQLNDVDMPFVPMTPRKPPQPNLGYLTPATRKSSVCASTSSTPSLATVPASPRMPNSSTSRGLAAMLDEVESPSASTLRSGRVGKSLCEEMEGGSGVGLGLGLPKSSSGIVRSSTLQRDLSRNAAEKREPSTSTTFTDPLNLTANSERSHSGSSSSSTVLPATRSISRSSTHSSLNANGLPRQPSSVSSAGTMRRTSVRRVSKSPLVQSTIPETPNASALSASPASAAIPRTPKIRHSRTQSHLSTLSGNLPPPPVPALPTVHIPSASGDKTSRTPSKPRAFPAELTRGLPPSASSPSLSAGLTPLGASKRIPSDKRPPPSPATSREERGKMSAGGEARKKEVKSVEEKKEMLGMWLGNVDQLVQGVEKVSFWGSIGNRGKAGR